MSESSLNTILDHRKLFLGFVRRRVLDPEIAETLLRDFPAFDRDKALNECGEVG